MKSILRSHVISLKNNVPLSDFGDVQIFII